MHDPNDQQEVEASLSHRAIAWMASGPTVHLLQQPLHALIVGWRARQSRTDGVCELR